MIISRNQFTFIRLDLLHRLCFANLICRYYYVASSRTSFFRKYENMLNFHCHAFLLKLILIKFEYKGKQFCKLVKLHQSIYERILIPKLSIFGSFLILSNVLFSYLQIRVECILMYVCKLQPFTSYMYNRVDGDVSDQAAKLSKVS